MREYRKAIDLKPEYATTHQWYGEALAYTGRLTEARAELDRAVESDPTSLIISDTAAWVFIFSRDYQGALLRLKKTMEMDPSFEKVHGDIAWIYALQGMYQDALAQLDKMPLAPDTSILSSRAFILALSGQRTQALELLHQVEERSRREYVPPSWMAAVWMALGNKDQAFALLMRGCAERDSGLWAGVKMDPSYDTLRSDPRWKELLRCVNLE
jgi:tetratricopeptide (TPR) repeat protein